MLKQHRDPCRIELAARNSFVTCDIDALGEPKPHQQEFVGALLTRQHLVGNEAMALRFHQTEPSLRALFSRGGVALAVDIEPPVSAGADAGIFVGSPIDEIVPALTA